MTNETLETIKKRRSCRAYKPEQITNEELDAVLEAGTYAASAMGRQSAKIVVVQDAAARAQLTRMNAAVMGRDTAVSYTHLDVYKRQHLQPLYRKDDGSGPWRCGGGHMAAPVEPHQRAEPVLGAGTYPQRTHPHPQCAVG